MVNMVAVLMAVWCVLLVLKESTAIAEMSVRLFGGATPFEGRVEVLLGGEWGVVLDNQWDIREATVTCRQLGFPAAKNFTTGHHFAPAHTATVVHIQSVACSGAESSLSVCSYDVGIRQQVKHHSRNAGVICAAGYSVRLSDGPSPYEGNLQVFLPGDENWVYVCHDASMWTTQGSQVACRELGYDQAVRASGNSADSSEVAVVTANCTGLEFNLQSCYGHAIDRLGNCSSGQRVCLLCEGTPSTPNSPQVVQSDCQSISVAWDEPYNNGGHPVTSYTLRYRPIENTIVSLDYVPWTMQNFSESPAELAGLLPGTIYLVSIAAANGVGVGPFSESSIAVTSAPGIATPLELAVLETGSTSTTVTWTVTASCGVEVSSYELAYNSSLNPDVQYTSHVAASSLLPSSTSTTTVNHTLSLLAPFSTYSLRARAFGDDTVPASITLNSTSETGTSRPLISTYSDSVTFQTKPDIPSAPPTSFTAFLRSSAYFSWGPVPEKSTNGIISHYFLSCHFLANGIPGKTNRYLSNTTQVYEMRGLMREAKYNCSIAAATQAGKGPQSAAIMFLTPPNLNVRPSPPRNVVFAILREHTDNTRQNIILQAKWALQDCGSNYSCIEVLGYMIICMDDMENEIRKIVWQFEFEGSNGVIVNTNLSVRPFTQYFCMISSLNSYGIGYAGSKVHVETYELSPTQSPSQVYATNIQSRSIRLHWTYNEDPPSGTLIAFRLDFYYQDPNNQDRVDMTRVPYRDVHYIQSAGPLMMTEFYQDVSYFLLPATDYIVFLYAVTGGGEGPEARMNFRTARTVPTTAPTNLLSTIITYTKPYLFRFSWEMNQPTAISRSMVHSGFNLYCSADQVVQPGTFVTAGQNIVTHSVFSSAVEESYSADIFMPTNCDSQIRYYLCSVAAFNEQGEGPQSENFTTYLPCDFKNSPLSSSVLAHPFFSLSLLGIIILMSITMLICCIATFLCYKNRRRNLSEMDKHYSSVGGETYDESYIHMAPSDFRSKNDWSLKRNHSLSQRMVPPIPTTVTSTMVDGPVNLDEVNTENPYDEIPGRKFNGQQYPHNPYAEINDVASRTRDSGVQLSMERNMTLSQPNSRAMQNRILPPPSTTRNSVNLARYRSSMVQEDNHPGTRISSRFESPPINDATNGVNHEAVNPDFIQTSPSTSTSLSGNDYIEVTATGELRSLSKRVYNSSNSLDKQAGLKCVFSAEPDPQVELEETKKCVHHYDNLVDVQQQEGGRNTGGQKEGLWEKSGASRRKSEFLEFFDNMGSMEKKDGSMASLIEADPYVSMACASLPEDGTEDLHLQKYA